MAAAAIVAKSPVWARFVPAGTSGTPGTHDQGQNNGAEHRVEKSIVFFARAENNVISCRLCFFVCFASRPTTLRYEAATAEQI